MFILSIKCLYRQNELSYMYYLAVKLLAPCLAGNHANVLWHGRQHLGSAGHLGGSAELAHVVGVELLGLDDLLAEHLAGEHAHGEERYDDEHENDGTAGNEFHLCIYM